MEMKHDIKWKALLPSLAIPLATGGLSAFLTKDGMRAFASLRQPPLSPPGWLFPVVWTILYLLMGVAAARVSLSEAGEKRRAALRLYLVQLGVNFVWPLLFFNRQAFGFAFVWLALLFALIVWLTLSFREIDRAAPILLMPYLLWVAFAGYLNLGVWMLNS